MFLEKSLAREANFFYSLELVDIILANRGGSNITEDIWLY